MEAESRCAARSRSGHSHTRIRLGAPLVMVGLLIGAAFVAPIAGASHSLTHLCTPRLPVYLATQCNHSPNTVWDRSPYYGASGQPTALRISWSGGDPDGDPVTYIVHLSGDGGYAWVQKCPGTSSSYCDVSGLANSKTYHWRVYAQDSYGASSTSSWWPFTTKDTPNNPPSNPHSHSPANGATGVNTNPRLSWSGGDDPDGDAVTYTVWMSGSQKCSGTSNKYCDVYGLAYSTTYYWKVVARDSRGAETDSDSWSFTTKAAPPPTNSPPYQPYNPVPANGATNQQVALTLDWEGGDPDGDPVTYTVHFSSNGGASWAEKCAGTSNSYCYVSGLSYSTTYHWRVVAQDDNGASSQGDWWAFTTKKDPNADTDGDGLKDTDEEAIGSDPNDPDTDDDGLLDGEEYWTYGTSVLKADTDGDVLDDYEEIRVWSTNAKNQDTDGDGLIDYMDPDNTRDSNPPDIVSADSTDWRTHVCLDLQDTSAMSMWIWRTNYDETLQRTMYQGPAYNGRTCYYFTYTGTVTWFQIEVSDGTNPASKAAFHLDGQYVKDIEWKATGVKAAVWGLSKVVKTVRALNPVLSILTLGSNTPMYWDSDGRSAAITYTWTYNAQEAVYHSGKSPYGGSDVALTILKPGFYTSQYGPNGKLYDRGFGHELLYRKTGIWRNDQQMHDYLGCIAFGDAWASTPDIYHYSRLDWVCESGDYVHKEYTTYFRKTFVDWEYK